MGLVQKAAFNVLKNGFKLKKGETFVAVCDKKNKFFSDALEEAASRLGADVKTFILEDFGSRPIKCPEEILRAVKTADAGAICCTEFEGELASLRNPVYDAARKNQCIRFRSMSGINRQAVEMGLNCDFRKVARFTDKVFSLVKDAKEIRVTTALGTDIAAKVGKYRWGNCNGDFKQGVIDDNYPEGEVMAAPQDVNGKLVIDGVLGDVFDARYGIIAKTPLTIYVKNGWAQKQGFCCSNKDIEHDVFNYIFKGDKYSSHVGELALGTNIFLGRLIGNLLQDEKFPSVHIAFGDCYPHETGAPWKSRRHIDMIMLKPDVYADGKLIMKKGKYLVKP